MGWHDVFVFGRKDIYFSARSYLNIEKPSPKGSKQVLFLLLQDLGTSILDHFDIVQNLLVHVLQAVHAVVSFHPGHLPRLLERWAKEARRDREMLA